MVIHKQVVGLPEGAVRHDDGQAHAQGGEEHGAHAAGAASVQAGHVSCCSGLLLSDGQRGAHLVRKKMVMKETAAMASIFSRSLRGARVWW